MKLRTIKRKLHKTISSKLSPFILVSLILLVILLTGFGWSGWIKEAALMETIHGTEQNTLTGVSEFYYKPAGDIRLWHVINNYDCSAENTKTGYNTSSYTFTADSVHVVNDYVSLPEHTQTELNILSSK